MHAVFMQLAWYGAWVPSEYCPLAICSGNFRYRPTWCGRVGQANDWHGVADKKRGKTTLTLNAFYIDNLATILTNVLLVALTVFNKSPEVSS